MKILLTLSAIVFAFQAHGAVSCEDLAKNPNVHVSDATDVFGTVFVRNYSLQTDLPAKPYPQDPERCALLSWQDDSCSWYPGKGFSKTVLTKLTQDQLNCLELP